MKQSAAILALFLGATSAVQLRAWGDDKKEVVLPPEKVHNLKPTHAQDLSNNLDSDYPTFPQPIGLGAGRTAFYAQTEQKHHHHHHHKAQDIGDSGIAEEVQQFASADKSVLPQPWRRAKEAYPINGFKNPSWNYINASQAEHKHHHHHHSKAKDIGDSGIAEEVQQFASADKSVLPQPWRRAKEAYPINGFKNPSWNYINASQAEHKHHHHHHHKAKDIGDSGIDEAVHGFASADKSVLPKPWRRAKEAYPLNGFKNASWQWLDKPEPKKSLAQHHHHHHAKAQDIGDSGIDESVQQFASADKSVLPKPWRRAKEAYPLNGFKNASWQWLDKPEPKKSLAQKVKKDISDQGIDEAVHGFASNDKSVLPQPWRRAKEPYPINGSLNPEFQHLDTKK